MEFVRITNFIQHSIEYYIEYTKHSLDSRFF